MERKERAAKYAIKSVDNVCRALLDNPAIALIENCTEIELEAVDNGWQALAGGEALASADCAIVATGTAANSPQDLSWLPLQAIRGQTTDLPSDAALGKLRAGLCHTGYISPARHEHHCIGATFDLRSQDPALRIEDHQRNLQALAAAVPVLADSLNAIDPRSLGGRVSYRCASPDYLPLVGPAPDYPAFLHTYRGLRKNARQTIAKQGNYMPGLFVTAGHGSRGLTSTPLSAEVLASQLCGELPPLSRELNRAIAPARFLIRKLSRDRL